MKTLIQTGKVCFSGCVNLFYTKPVSQSKIKKEKFNKAGVRWHFAKRCEGFGYRQESVSQNIKKKTENLKKVKRIDREQSKD